MRDLLKGKRILVVEDDYFIAADMARVLQRDGMIVIGPVGSVAEANDTLGTHAPDAAILDIELGSKTSYRLADRLIGENVPVLFVTGYDGWHLPEPYVSQPRLTKPTGDEELVSVLHSMMKDGRC
ncbi:response regulator [Pelagerythrobacter rhizovicinus]|uniref:Response regulator n=1 Tax=Pelagerythrobacter rhizovicinus TaxID=2268576 RepID=A0A4Q2KJQ1_9SPHN|nr:response regulator [Pelagerythrobacter rhizovicinus]RXZ65438.1 response regulator [Pelagerythrobacter rhizovicinus]